MRHQLFVHLAWTTRRRPVAGVAEVVRRVVEEEGAEVLELGSAGARVQVVLRVGEETVLPRLIRRIEGVSGRVGVGCEVLSVSPRVVEIVREGVRGWGRGGTQIASAAVPPRNDSGG